MSFTGSAFERVRACPASAALPQINTTSEWAETGLDGHGSLNALVRAINGGVSVAEALERVPDEWSALCGAVAQHVKPWALRSEASYAYNVATGAARFLGCDLERRYHLGPFEVACTLDLDGQDKDAAVVIDAKTGHGDVTPAERNQQLRFQALCAARARGLDHARVALLRCTEGGSPRWDWAHLEVWDLDATAQEVLDAFTQVSAALIDVNAGRVPDVTEGGHCKYCPAAPVCPAKTSLIRQMADLTAFEGAEFLKPLSPEQAGIAYRRLQAFKALAKPIEAAIMAALEERGELPLPDGKVLRRVLVPGNEALDGDVVHQVVTELHGRDIADAAVERKATKKRLKDALQMATVRGGTSEAERRVLDEVRKRGGASKGTKRELEEIDRGR